MVEFSDFSIRDRVFGATPGPAAVDGDATLAVLLNEFSMAFAEQNASSLAASGASSDLVM